MIASKFYVRNNKITKLISSEMNEMERVLDSEYHYLSLLKFIVNIMNISEYFF